MSTNQVPSALDPLAQGMAKDQSSKHQPAATQPPHKKTWTGFAGKTLWDWLNLLGKLLIPIVIASASIWFSAQQNATSLQLAQRQHQNDQALATDQQQAATLNVYMNDMTDLLLHQGLQQSKADDEVRVIAKAKTLTALRGVNGERRGALIRFLSEAKLIGGLQDPLNEKSTYPAIVNLFLANLQGADLSGAPLQGADLRLTFLSEAKLQGADLREANLAYSNVTADQLAQAGFLRGATLPDGSTYPTKSYPIPNHKEPSGA